MNTLLNGTVTASFGRHYEVTMAPGELPVDCVRRGKKQDVACGDQVQFRTTGKGQGVIESVSERHTLLYRADALRQKLLAANVDQVLVVVAPEPAFSEELLTRCLLAADAAGIAAAIVLNKWDLGAPALAAAEQLSYYTDLGYPLLRLSARQDPSLLQPVLQGHVSILVGQSGMGKSTLVNALVPDARARTGEISQALGTGRHTTTSTRYYALQGHGALIDSPGLQEFGLAYLSPAAIATYFREFSGLVGQCRFSDCRHLQEPDCALKNWAAGHPRRELRLRYLTALQQENERARRP
ncbi:MAG: ribosome small subunit-dependent GTPase A [Betaproteobacteria bacterium]|nr:ribosome small subunit-dependent GTPase A [Betaproteobacteria bacterium]MDE2622184.1 ribosome small subunit-dependent GTPase A [Betaproteobacteria bacterium]